jgi:hypothetical protein
MLFGSCKIYLIKSDDKKLLCFPNKGTALEFSIDQEIQRHQSHFEQWIALRGYPDGLQTRLRYIKENGYNKGWAIGMARIPAREVPVYLAGGLNAIGFVAADDGHGYQLDIDFSSDKMGNGEKTKQTKITKGKVSKK